MGTEGRDLGIIREQYAVPAVFPGLRERRRPFRVNRLAVAQILDTVAINNPDRIVVAWA
jgi:hypothetical protein